MIPVKRKSSGSSQANSPPPSRNSPSFTQMSPPYGMSLSPSQSGLLTTAAAAAGAFKRATASTPRRTSGGTASPSRQGSVEVEHEATPQPSQPEEPEDNTQPQKEEVENDDDEKDDGMVGMDVDMNAYMEERKEDLKLLLDNFDEEQIQRYEAYRRAALNRNVKRLVGQVLNQQCSPMMAYVVAGFTKVYAGEIIEQAREVMEEWGHTGAIRPEHLREARRRYKKERAAKTAVGKKLFLR